MDRRQFIGKGIAATAALSLGQISLNSCASPKPGLKPFSQSFTAPDGDIRAFLIHLGENMWCDWPSSRLGATLEEAIANLPEAKRPEIKLRCDYDVWKKVTDHAAAKGLNVLVVDVGEGLVLPSHPELAVEGSWTVEFMREEISRLNALGLEVIPKLNFSTTHNGWLKDYRHMVSSEPYYKACEEILADVHEIFGKPRFFHIGFDEEDTWHTEKFTYQIRRIDESWWCDFLHIVHTVENLGARPWVWSDYGWDHPEYFERCPKSVIQQDWYYDESYGGFDPETNTTSDHKRLIEMWDLDKAGFDQIPCGTNWTGWKRKQENVGADDVIGKLVLTGRKAISKQHLKGFMMAPWSRPTCAEKLDTMLSAIDLMADAIAQD